MILHPLTDRIVAQPEKPQQKTKSGLALPKADEGNSPRLAVVLAIGEAVKHVKVGDRIYFQAFAATTIALGDIGKKDEYIVIREEFVDCTVDRETK